MPPALSDTEQSDNDFDIPVPTTRDRSTKSRTPNKSDEEMNDEPVENGDAEDVADVKEGDDEDDADEDGDEEVYGQVHIVAAIPWLTLDAVVSSSKKSSPTRLKMGYFFQLNLRLARSEGAPEIIAEYYKSVGSRAMILEESRKGKETKKRGRPASSTPASSSKRARKSRDHPSDSTPPASATANTWKPPSGSWEDDVTTIDACEDEETGKLIVYLNWKNGQKTKHTTDVIYKRCPQKMLQFYERHIRIIKTATGTTDAELK
ncbi:heterochromatin protein one [Verticillium dahliae VdLs.17]|uniref:Heterochromatin protein one n=1 Tax=Verticillium dahliae (strain VdLs.17 / ATCC MYA-4575 / FGSC 10137) TaxID=498257 RepID=G2X5T5_VERDV|nr:heterochromatin protein one [Verticillium dahliae VdLs.17]EGY14426.1 heterochromatin protein one [Verticillium dahliae VdLs.17]